MVEKDQSSPMYISCSNFPVVRINLSLFLIPFVTLVQFFLATVKPGKKTTKLD